MMNIFGLMVLINALTGFIEAGLLVAVLRKAGFGWGIALTGLAPPFGIFMQNMLFADDWKMPYAGTLLNFVCALLPLLILAFKAWPKAALHTPPSEIFE